MGDETVTITKREYDRLLDDSLKLGCLEDMGVDNWCGYDDAQKLYREERKNGRN